MYSGSLILMPIAWMFIVYIYLLVSTLGESQASCAVHQCGFQPNYSRSYIDYTKTSSAGCLTQWYSGSLMLLCLHVYCLAVSQASCASHQCGFQPNHYRYYIDYTKTSSAGYSGSLMLTSICLHMFIV